MGVLQIARWWNSAPDLPDVSKCFLRVLKASMPATPRYFAWGCFRYFVFDRCRSEEPELRSTRGGEWVACHLEALPEEQDPLSDPHEALPISTPAE